MSPHAANRIIITEEDLRPAINNIFTPLEEAEMFLEDKQLEQLDIVALRGLAKQFHPDNPDGLPANMRAETGAVVSQFVNQQYDAARRAGS